MEIMDYLLEKERHIKVGIKYASAREIEYLEGYLDAIQELIEEIESGEVFYHDIP